MTLLKIPKLEFIAQNKKDLRITEGKSFSPRSFRFLFIEMPFFHIEMLALANIKRSSKISSLAKSNLLSINYTK
jgi:hypothetical protein